MIPPRASALASAFLFGISIGSSCARKSVPDGWVECSPNESPCGIWYDVCVSFDGSSVHLWYEVEGYTWTCSDLECGNTSAAFLCDLCGDCD